MKKIIAFPVVMVTYWLGRLTLRFTDKEEGRAFIWAGILIWFALDVEDWADAEFISENVDRPY